MAGTERSRYTACPMDSRRLSPRLAIMLVFSAFGSIVGVWAGSIPQVTAQATIGNSWLGIAFSMSTFAAVSAMGLAGVLSKLFSNRSALLVLLPAALLLTVAMMGSTSPLAFLVFIVLQAVAMGLMDIFMNAEASFIEHRLRRPVFQAFHGIASLCMAVFAIASSFITASVGPLYSCIPAVVMTVLAWVAVARLVQKHPPPAVGQELQSIRRLWWHVPLLLMGLAMGLAISAESAAVFWSAKLIQEQSPDLARIYGIGVAFFGCCQALLRFSGDRLRARFGEINVMLVSFATAAVAFSVLGLSPPLAVSIIAFAFIGMGLACISPCLFVLAASESPQNRAAGMGVVSLVAGLPRVVTPLLFGWISTSGGMVAVFGLAAFLPLAGIAIVLWLRSHSSKVTVSA